MKSSQRLGEICLRQVKSPLRVVVVFLRDD